MSQIYLKFFNGTVFTETTVPLRSYNYMFTTKKPLEGRWYYEVTHVGGDNRSMMGFGYDENYQSSFLLSKFNTPNWQIYYYENIQVHTVSINTITNPNTDIPELGSYESGFTVGLAYDTYSQIFTVYYNDRFIHFNINCSNCSNNRISPVFIERTSSEIIYEDILTFNFGTDAFKYGIPKGYLPWNAQPKINTCKENIHIFSQMILLYSTIYIK